MALWNLPKSAPTNKLVQAYFGDLPASPTVDGPNIWTCWQDDLGNWYGDGAIRKPAPKRWRHLPTAPETVAAPQLKAGRRRGESRGQLTGRAKLAKRNHLYRFRSVSKREAEETEIDAWLLRREAETIDDLTDEQKHEFIKWLKGRAPK